MKKVVIVAVTIFSLFLSVLYIIDLNQETESSIGSFPMNKADYLNKINGYVFLILNRQETNATNMILVMKGSMKASEEVSNLEETLRYEENILAELKVCNPPKDFITHKNDFVRKVKDSKSTIQKCIDILNGSKKESYKTALEYLEKDFAGIKTLHETVN